METLSTKKVVLYIATNKRQHPTHLILEHLSWNSFFRNAYALDGVTPAHSSKAAMLGHLLHVEGIDPTQAFYIGDKQEDGYAADQNNLKFFAACWGYGALTTDEMRPGWELLRSPSELLEGISDWMSSN